MQKLQSRSGTTSTIQYKGTDKNFSEEFYERCTHFNIIKDVNQDPVNDLVYFRLVQLFQTYEPNDLTREIIVDQSLNQGW